MVGTPSTLYSNELFVCPTVSACKPTVFIGCLRYDALAQIRVLSAREYALNGKQENFRQA